MNLTISIEIPADLVCGFSKYAAALGIGKNPEVSLSNEATIFALRRIVAGTPIEGSLLASLERDFEFKQMITSRSTKIFSSIERLTTDSAVLIAAVQHKLPAFSRCNVNATKAQLSTNE
jgi:hypothetical protein